MSEGPILANSFSLTPRSFESWWCLTCFLDVGQVAVTGIR